MGLTFNSFANSFIGIFKESYWEYYQKYYVTADGLIHDNIKVITDIFREDE